MLKDLLEVLNIQETVDITDHKAHPFGDLNKQKGGNTGFKIYYDIKHENGKSSHFHRKVYAKDEKAAKAIFLKQVTVTPSSTMHIVQINKLSGFKNEAFDESKYIEETVVDEYATPEQQANMVGQLNNMIDINNSIDIDPKVGYIPNDETEEDNDTFSDEEKLYFSLETTVDIFESLMLMAKFIYKGLGDKAPVMERLINREAFDELKTLFNDLVVTPINSWLDNKEVQKIISTRFYNDLTDMIIALKKADKINEEFTFGSKLSDIFNYLESTYTLMIPLIHKIKTESDYDYSDIVIDFNRYIQYPWEYKDPEFKCIYHLNDYVTQ